MSSQSVDRLKADYPDEVWQKKFAEISDLIEMLGDCIIGDSYVISDELNSSIRLTAVGGSLLDRLTRKEGVNAKDARLMCALTLGHSEPFIDVESMDVERLAAAIHDELIAKHIRFPFTFGREFYDAYSLLHADEKDFLTNEQSLQLLDQLPMGVFQYGSYTIGPYGLQASLSSRNLQSSKRVPAYHCAQPTCHLLHPVTLETSRNASINRDRPKLEKLLREDGGDPEEWWAFASDISGFSNAYYGDQRSGTLIPLIGDSLTTRELRRLVEELFDRTPGNLRQRVSSFVKVKKARDATESLDRAQLLQIALLVQQDEIAGTLDRLVQHGIIIVPEGDVRRPVTNKRSRSGAFRLRAELGHHGVRFVSNDPGLPLLRERRLLNKLYLRGPEADVQELEWQLRGIDIEDLDEKLEHFFQTTSPARALERLVLARKTNMITACHEIGIENGDELSDEELIKSMLWKLGFPIYTDEDPHKTFWRRHERLWALTQSSEIGGSEKFLETASPYFAELEGILLDSLAFTSWALLLDHTRSDTPFSYDDHEDRRQGLQLLQGAQRSTDGREETPVDYTSEKIDLRSLIHGFSILASHLRHCQGESESHTRPESELPEYDGKTTLKEFLFRSTIPFLDLAKPSQERIITGLKGIGTAMAKAEVNLVRNDYSHYRRNAPDIIRIENALEATRQAVTRIENFGFCRLLFAPGTVTTDRWGQSGHEFTGPRSYEHTITRPTRFDWMGLPTLDEPQYLIRAADFGNPHEVLRFTRRFPSDFSIMWGEYPNRRRRGQSSPSGDDTPSHANEVGISAS